MENDRLKLDELIGYLIVNHKNLLKSPNRQYLISTLEKKQTYCDNIFLRAKEYLKTLENKLSAQELAYYENKLTLTHQNIKAILERKIKLVAMPPKLDLGLAMKLVNPFDGSSSNLQQYMESVNLLKDYATDIPEADILIFMKITLTGAAHGFIDATQTINDAFTALKNKFAVKLTPRAVENEMFAKKTATCNNHGLWNGN